MRAPHPSPPHPTPPQPAADAKAAAARFDTGSFSNGRFYRLDAHVERILRNAGRASIDHPFTKEGLIDTICQTVRSTGLRDGSVRYFLTAGHGGFSWLPDECIEAGFYCIVIGPPPFRSAAQHPAPLALLLCPAEACLRPRKS